MNLNYKQNLAIDKLSKLRAGALFMKMGTGKTKVAVELSNLRNDYDYIVWIAPASLINMDNYKQEIYKWNPNKEIKYWTIESIGSSDNKYCELVSFIEKYKTFCIVDESITIKNLEAKRTERLLKIWDKFNYRLILNGTPLTNGLIDLYSQINFIHPKILSMTETQFANNFLIYREDRYKPWKRWSKPANEEALIEIIRPYIFDCDLDLKVELKEKIVNCYNSIEEQEEYQVIKNKFFKQLEKDGKDIDFFSMTQLFQHKYTICNDKLMKVKELIAEIKNRNEKVIVYVKYLDEIKQFEDYNCLILTGNNKDKNIINKFKKDYDILICTYGCGSFGLNLQFANNIIFLSQTFDYRMKEQAKHRIYRTGQNKSCNIYNFYVNTGLEDLIKKSLDKKQNTLKNVENFIKKEGYEKL